MPAHDCCNNCAQLCNCGGNDCTVQLPQHDLKPVQAEIPLTVTNRPVSEVDKQDLENGLYEMVNPICHTLKLLDLNSTQPDYAKQLVQSIVERSHAIFTVNDIVDYFPVFSIHHALKIIELFNEIFEDIPNLDAMVEVFGIEEIDMPPTLAMPLEHYNFNKSDDDDDLFTFDEDILLQ